MSGYPKGDRFFCVLFGRITKIWELILRYSDYKRFLLFLQKYVQ